MKPFTSPCTIATFLGACLLMGIRANGADPGQQCAALAVLGRTASIFPVPIGIETGAADCLDRVTPATVARHGEPWRDAATLIAHINEISRSLVTQWTSGTLVIRPASQVNRGQSILDTYVGAFSYSGGSLDPVLNALSAPFSGRRFKLGLDVRIAQRINQSVYSGEAHSHNVFTWVPGAEPTPRPFAFSGGTLAEALSTIAAAQAMSSGWIVTYCGGTPSMDTAVIMFPFDYEGGTVRRYVSLVGGRSTSNGCSAK